MSEAWQTLAFPCLSGRQNRRLRITSIGRQRSSAGGVYVAKSPEQFTYDADGNLLSDGRWNYTWDAENRLVKMESLTNAPSGSKLRLEFTYDTSVSRHCHLSS